MMKRFASARSAQLLIKVSAVWLLLLLAGCSQQPGAEPAAQEVEVATVNIPTIPPPTEAAATVVPPPVPTLAPQFYDETELGRVLVAYLTCFDVDCFEAMEQLQTFGEEAAPPLVALLYAEAASVPGVEVVDRQRVVQALGNLDAERAVPHLLPLLAAPDPLLRAETAHALGQIAPPEAVPALVPLLSDPDALVRERAALALVEVGDRVALPPLRAAAAAEQNDFVRGVFEEAITALEDGGG